MSPESITSQWSCNYALARTAQLQDAELGTQEAEELMRLQELVTEYEARTGTDSRFKQEASLKEHYLQPVSKQV